MDKSGADKKKIDSGTSEESVVMRKPRFVLKPHFSIGWDTPDGNAETGGETGKNKKQVKWSESTELRERLKVYRRSQLDIPLDYQHLAIEEKREREGVKVWRTHLIHTNTDDEVEVPPLVNLNSVSTASATGSEDPDYDSDEDGDPTVDEDLERKLQMIKEETTKLTLYPAYSAAIPVYEEWLAETENTNKLTQEQLDKMTNQLDLYKRLVAIYKDWTQEHASTFPRESRFGEVTKVLQEASNLGQPPACVSKAIREVLTDEENIQRQVGAYNSQVQEMIASLDITNKV